MSVLSAGAIYINIDADTKSFEKGLDRARRELGQLDNKADRTERGVGKSFSGIGNIAQIALGSIAANAVSALAGSIVDLGKQALLSGDQYNQSMLKYETLLGSKELATERVKQLEDFAAKTPFETGEIQKADILLQGFGIRSEKLLTTIGDASAISGSGFADLGLVIGQLSQSKDLENIKQLVERGVVSFDELREAGIEFADNGSVVNSVDETYGAVVGIMEKKFGGGMEKLSGTLTGQLSTLTDNFNLFLGALVRDSGILDLVTAGVAGMTPVIQELGNISSILFKGDFKGLFGLSEDDPIVDLLFRIRENFMTFMTALQENAPTAFGQAYELLKPLLDALKLLGESIIPLIPPVIDQLVATAQFAFPYIQDLVKHWVDIIAPIIERVAKEIIPALYPVMMQLFELFRTLLPIVAPILKMFMDLVGNVWNAVITIIGGAIRVISGLLDILLGVFTGDGERIKQGFLSIFSGLAQIVNGIFKGIINGIIIQLNFGFSKVNELIDKIPEGARPSKLPQISQLYKGGRANANQPYLVGENPDGSINDTTELFVPNRSGKVYSSSELQQMLTGESGGKGDNYFTFNGTLIDRNAISQFFRQTKGIAKKEGFSVT